MKVELVLSSLVKCIAILYPPIFGSLYHISMITVLNAAAILPAILMLAKSLDASVPVLIKIGLFNI